MKEKRKCIIDGIEFDTKAGSNRKTCCSACAKIYNRQYVSQYMKVYNRRPEVQARKNLLNHIPKVKEYKRQYMRKYMRTYTRTPKTNDKRTQYMRHYQRVSRWKKGVHPNHYWEDDVCTVCGVRR